MKKVVLDEVLPDDYSGLWNGRLGCAGASGFR